MKVKGYILCMCLALTAVAGYGQKTDRDYLRSGNKLYKDSLFVKAEVDYRKALELNPKSADAMYNLGNALMMQEKAKEAMEQFDAASRLERTRRSWHRFTTIWESFCSRPNSCRSVLKPISSPCATIRRIMKPATTWHWRRSS